MCQVPRCRLILITKFVMQRNATTTVSYLLWWSRRMNPSVIFNCRLSAENSLETVKEAHAHAVSSVTVTLITSCIHILILSNRKIHWGHTDWLFCINGQALWCRLSSNVPPKVLYFLMFKYAEAWLGHWENLWFYCFIACSRIVHSGMSAVKLAWNERYAFVVVTSVNADSWSDGPNKNRLNQHIHGPPKYLLLT